METTVIHRVLYPMQPATGSKLRQLSPVHWFRATVRGLVWVRSVGFGAKGFRSNRVQGFHGVWIC